MGKPVFHWRSRYGAAAALVAAVCVCVACATGGGPRVQYWRASDIAQSYAPAVRLNDAAKNVVATVNPARVRRIVAVKERIERAAGLGQAELVIATGDRPNAFASDTPKGRLVAVNIAMMDMLGDDADAYAAVIGHEYAHLVKGHGAARKQREQARSGASNVLGAVLRAAGVPLGGTIASVATTAVERIYTRDEEREADQLGFDYLLHAGFDPGGAVRAWQQMSARGAGTSIPFLATHPPSDERLRTLSEMAEKARLRGSDVSGSPEK